MSESTPPEAAAAPKPDTVKPAADVIVLDDDEAVIDLVGQVTVAGDRKCINYLCKSGVNLFTPPIFCMSFYRVKNDSNKNQKICSQCYNIAVKHYDELYEAVTEGGNLMEVQCSARDETFAIDDSDSEDDAEKEPETMLDPATVELLEGNLDEVMMATFEKINYEQKVDEAVQYLGEKYEANNMSYLEVKTMVDSIRKDVDDMLLGLFGKLRVDNITKPELIIPFEEVVPETSGPPPLRVYNTAGLPKILPKPEPPGSATAEPPEPLSSTPMPPYHLPNRGVLKKPLIKAGQLYFAKRNTAVSSWMKVKLEQIVPPGTKVNNVEYPTTMYQVVREIATKISMVGTPSHRYVTGKELAYTQTLDVILEVGSRVIALFKEYGDLRASKRDAYYPGIVGEIPGSFNKYRYLIFFDDGYAHYVHYKNVYLIYESSKDVWEDVNADSRTFIKKYLTDYPNRPMVKLMKNQTIRTEFRGKWYVTTVMNIDCSLVQIFFDSHCRAEWIYRGSRRLNTMYKEEQAASSRLQNRQRVPRAITATSNAPYVEYTRGDGDVIYVPKEGESPEKPEVQRSVAKKSTRTPIPAAADKLKPFLPSKSEGPPGKIVYYTPRKQNPNAKIYRPHNCSHVCQKDTQTFLQKLKGYGPLAKPLLCGFHRLHYKVRSKKPFVIYKTPCGRTVRDFEELHAYLRVTKSELTIDLFNFDVYVRCLAEFILEPNNPIIKDLSDGVEEIVIPVVNYVDTDLNNFVNYSNTRMPMDGVHLNLDPDFLVGCDCEDDCTDKSKCSCWQLTLEGQKFLGKEPDEIGYSFRRLQEPVYTGIYECNSRCKCAKTCLNRVVQNPLQHKLQVFKTVKRGWGIRCINDIPQGSFICIYAGLLLTEQNAEEGKAEGDEYLAELDYIESVENAKEEYEEHAYESEEEKSRASTQEDEDEEEEESKEELRKRMRSPDDDDEYKMYVNVNAGSISTRLRKKAMIAMEAKEKERKANRLTLEDECVTISDDEDVREPSSFNPQALDDDDDENKSKYKSVRKMFGSDESVYIMDAKNTGNIGRYLNHSCSPNIFVQNVFVDTHDLRFPWVSFFAMNYIRAGTELTWNYNYDIGSVQDKVLHCHCGSSECKGRLL